MDKEETMLILSALELADDDEKAEMIENATRAAYEQMRKENPEFCLMVDDFAQRLRYVGPISCIDLFWKLYVFLEADKDVLTEMEKQWETRFAEA